MAARTSSASPGAGVSSMSFWWRRCVEQSRSPSHTALPCVSANTWISMCRGRVRYRSRYVSGRPKYAWLSRAAESSADWASSGPSTTFMPRPPPPNAALIATGQPCCSPKATTWSALVVGSSVPGTASTPADAAAVRAEILSPMISIASGGGPIQVTSRSVMARAKSAFSAKNPYPGCTASARLRVITSMMASVFR